MNKHPFNKSIQSIKKVKLTSSEKEVVLARLTEYTGYRPVRAVSSAIRTPWYNTFFGALRKPRFVYSFASVLLVCLVGYGTVSAAEGALPGDLLYAVKIHINEPVIGSLAVTTSAKVDWEVKKVDRRLVEAETLAVRGKLSVAAKQDIEQQLDLHIKTFEKFSATLEKEQTSTSATLAIGVENNVKNELSNYSRKIEKTSLQVKDHEKQEQVNDVKKIIVQKQEQVRAILAGRMRTAVIASSSATTSAPVSSPSIKAKIITPNQDKKTGTTSLPVRQVKPSGILDAVDRKNP